MLTLVNAIIKLFEKREFTNADTGEKSTRYTYYLQCHNDAGDQSIFVVNSKKDFTTLVDQRGTATVTPYEQEKGSGFWLSLTGFTPDIED